MGENDSQGISRGQWMALSAALLGWMFDGLEMGLFPLVAGPSLRNLLDNPSGADVLQWFNIATAAFLVGAATGGVLFGWLGDRIGRVRSMMFSVLTYALFSGACGFANSAIQITVLRFISALGMGGEWSLGVALVMEIWPDRSRAFLAGLIGAAANLGYMLIAAVGLGLSSLLPQTGELLLAVGLPQSWVHELVGHDGWRLLMMIGALPALLTFFIRLFVAESERWQEEQSKGSTSHWATRDLLGVCIGALAALGIIYLWAGDHSLVVRIVGSMVALIVVTLGYLYPVIRYVQRLKASNEESATDSANPIPRMLLGACLGGVALLGTWASIQQAPTWAYELTSSSVASARANTQMCSAGGAIVGTIAAALLGGWLGRRVSYFLLCLTSLGWALLMYQCNTSYGGWFFFTTVILARAGTTASFYGWLPLYLPELFRTKVRATGQGFSFNFGRIIAAVGALQGGFLIKEVFVNPEAGNYAANYATVCSIMSLIYVVGMVIIWFAPETLGKPLPE